MDVEGSRVWFTDLWNYSLVPYLLEAVREGLQVSPEQINRIKRFTRTVLSTIAQTPGCTSAFLKPVFQDLFFSMLEIFFLE